MSCKRPCFSYVVVRIGALLSSTKTTLGFDFSASSGVSWPYAMMITLSPTFAQWAAAPLRQTIPLAVVHVSDLDALVFADVRGVEQVLVDGDRADVVELGLRYGCAVDFSDKHF